MKKLLTIGLTSFLLITCSCGIRSENETITNQTFQAPQTTNTQAESKRPEAWPLIGLEYDRHAKGNYSFNKDQLKYGDAINVDFPQFTKMKDSKKQKNINEFIRKFAMNLITEDIGGSIDNIDEYEFLQVSYRIALQAHELIRRC